MTGCARRGFEHPSEVAFGRDWKVGVNDCPAHAEIDSVSDGRGCGSVEAAAEVGIFAKNPDALRFSPCRYPWSAVTTITSAPAAAAIRAVRAAIALPSRDRSA